MENIRLSDHLLELRRRIIFCFFILCIGFILCWIFKDYILKIVSYPISPYLMHNEGRLIFTAPMDEFLAQIKISSFGALVLGFPFFIYQAWSFLAPGLYKAEKKMILFFSIFGSMFFLFGILFIYFIVYPLSFKFLIGSTSSVAMISIREYLSFYIQTSLAFGFLFETPLIVMGLVMMNIISVDQLKRSRSYVIVLLATISAFITPPDVFSMLFLLIPLYLLFEISIFISSKIN